MNAGWRAGPDTPWRPRARRPRQDSFDSRGWSRPEFNVSFGIETSGRPRPQGRAADFRYAWRSPAEIDARPPQRWRTGEPWGFESDADRVRARDLMTANPEVVTADTPLLEVARRMRDLDVGIIPVVDDAERGILQGVITDRDIVIRAAAQGVAMDNARAGDYMSTGVSSVDEADTVRDIFTVMKRERVRRVPVTDFTGRLTGIIAFADLAVDYAQLDLERELEVEEVMGRISEPATPRFGAGRRSPRSPRYERDLIGRVRRPLRAIRRGARRLLERGLEHAPDAFRR